jgi:phage FluMu protein Com
MATRLRCPQCRTTLEIPGEVPVGKTVRCPACNTVFTRTADVADEEDEEEDRPRRKLKKRKKHKAGTPIWLQVVGAVICLAIIGFCIAIVVAKRSPKDEDKVERVR